MGLRLKGNPLTYPHFHRTPKAMQVIWSVPLLPLQPQDARLRWGPACSPQLEQHISAWTLPNHSGSSQLKS